MPSRRDAYHEFIGLSTLVQLLGLAMLVGGIAELDEIGWIGVGIATVPAVILFVIGSRMSRRWRCGACKNPLASGDVTVCPICREALA